MKIICKLVLSKANHGKFAVHSLLFAFHQRLVWLINGSNATYDRDKPFFPILDYSSLSMRCLPSASLR